MQNPDAMKLRRTLVELLRNEIMLVRFKGLTDPRS
jgi:hypothetical protein